MKLPFVISSALILSLSAAQAADFGAPLAAGKPAGVHRAQLLDDGNGIFLVAGAALVGITVALATASDPQGIATGATSPTASSTSTTGTNP